jgi:hypothetical protein
MTIKYIANPHESILLARSDFMLFQVALYKASGTLNLNTLPRFNLDLTVILLPATS